MGRTISLRGKDAETFIKAWRDVQPHCSVDNCDALGLYEVRGHAFCFQHAKKAVRWKEGGSDGKQHG